MSVRQARVDDLRGTARALRTSAARCGLAAWQTGQACASVPSWQGANARAWVQQGLALGAAARALEDQLRRLATAAELYAAAVEAGQSQLRALDAETDALAAATGRALQEWEAAPGGERGLRPHAAGGLAALDLRRGAVEEDAEQAARAYAAHVAEVCADTARPPSAESVLRAVLDSSWLEYGYSLPSAVLDVAGPVLVGLGRARPAVEAAVRSLPEVPHGLLLPLRVVGVVGAPFAFVSDVRTLAGDDEPGARDDVDRVVAGVSVVGTTVGVAGAVATALGATAVGAAVLPAVVAVSVLAGGYQLGTWAWDHRPGRRARPVPPVARALRTPAPRLPRPQPSSSGAGAGAGRPPAHVGPAPQRVR